MTHRPLASFSTLSLSSLERIDAQCGDFEKQLKDHSQPLIEDFLTFDSENENQLLLRELLHMEVTHKKSQGLIATQVDYETRFSGHEAIVRETFGGASGKDADDRDYKGQVVDERYKVGILLGAGAFSRVYLAEDLKENRPVALKILKSDVGIDVERLIDEAETLAGLDHPNIAAAYGSGRIDDVGYIAMQFVDGSTLADMISSYGALPSDEVIRLTSSVCDALHLAHQKGLTHRDVKPENIIVDSSGEPFVADFGFALHESDQDHHYGDRSGTPYYRSPEQVRGEADWIDGRADVWAVGVMMYEILTGRRPFQGDTIEEIDRQILGRPPKPPRQIDSSIPKWLEAVTLKSLSPLAGDRYSTANELADALRNQEHPRKAKLSRNLLARIAFAMCLLGLMTLGAFGYARHQHLVAERAKAETLSMFELTLRNFLKKNSEPLPLIEKYIENMESNGLDKSLLLLKARVIAADFLVESREGHAKAQEALEELNIELSELARGANQKDKPPFLRMHGDVCDLLGGIAKAAKQSDLALEWYERGLAYREEWLSIAESVPRVNSSPFLKPPMSIEPDAFKMTATEAAEHFIAFSHLAIGQVHRSSGRLDTALTSFDKLISLRRKLHEAHPGFQALKREYGGALRDLGAVQYQRRDYAAAVDNYKQAVKLTREVIYEIEFGTREKKLDALPPKFNDAMFSQELATAHMKNGEWSEPERLLQESISSYNSLLNQYPNKSADLWKGVRVSHRRLGRFYSHTGQEAKAAKHFQLDKEYAAKEKE